MMPSPPQHNYNNSKYNSFYYKGSKIQTSLTINKGLPLTKHYNNPVMDFLPILKKDPKPVFDNLRNAGIATIIIIGAGTIRNRTVFTEPLFIYISDIATWGLAIGGAILFIWNMLFAQHSIYTTFKSDEHNQKKAKYWKFLNKSHTNRLLAHVSTIAYHSLLLLIAFTQFYSTPVEKQPEPKKELYLNLEKIIPNTLTSNKDNQEKDALIKDLKEQIESLKKTTPPNITP